VVVVGGRDVVAALEQREEEGGRVRATGEGDQDSLIRGEAANRRLQGVRARRAGRRAAALFAGSLKGGMHDSSHKPRIRRF
jgi:hypothetical protein